MTFDLSSIKAKYGKKIPSRIKSLKSLIENYTHFVRESDTVDIQFEADSADMIVYTYFHLLDIGVKPFLKDRAEKFKMASLSEIAICIIKPIQHNDEVTKARLNARFAFFCGMHIMFDMNQPIEYEVDPLTSNNKHVNNGLEKIFRAHLEYLTFLNSKTKNPPIVSNSFFWEFTDFIFTFQWQVINI